MFVYVPEIQNLGWSNVQYWNDPLFYLEVKELKLSQNDSLWGVNWFKFKSGIPAAPNCIKDFLDLSGNSGKSDLTLQMFPMETIVMLNLIDQNKAINRWIFFIQLVQLVKQLQVSGVQPQSV